MDRPQAEAPAMLESRRLCLRALTDADTSEARFIAHAAQGAGGGSALVWGIFEVSSGRFIGAISLNSGLDLGRSKIGCWIRSDRQEKGYAAEAGKLAIEYGFRKRGLHKIYARIDPANRPFRKMLKKLGFRYEGCLRSDKRLNGRWIDQECWGLLKTERKR